MSRIVLCLCLGLASITLASAADKPNVAKPNGNRLTYLDEPCNPWYPHLGFPKLTTPMWVGEEGVEAVVILGIDDMRGHEKWEAYLRPILTRLKQIDGRAPVSIFTCSIDPKQPHLQQWLEEGLSLEIHTIDHPCPLLKDGDLAKAKSTVDRCIDLLNEVPNNKPVCFRTPCCDSLNTLSPRFFTEIFAKTTAKGNFLQADSSVMQVFTSADPALPRELVLDADGREKFKKYLPTDRFFANSIENYPYPYVIDRLCWEFPCVAPSDWAAQHFHKPHNPKTVEDWKAALDCTVIKQGVFCLVFHPHNWIKPEQVNELIDHAVTKHGKKVKFLNFREAVERLNKNVLGGRSLRDEKGNDNGVRLLDFNNDGFIDTVSGHSKPGRSAMWNPEQQQWSITGFPVDPRRRFVRFVPSVHFLFGPPPGLGAGVLDAETEELWAWIDGRWQGPNPERQTKGASWPFGSGEPRDKVQLSSAVERDFWGNGGDWLVKNQGKGLAPAESPDERMRLARYNVQDGRSGAIPKGFPNHLRPHWGSSTHGWAFVDIDEDGIDDLIFSNADEYLVALAREETKPYINWKQPSALLYNVILQGQRGSKPANEELPPIVRADGSNNGFWVHSRNLVWMNEDTAKSKDLVERRTFEDILARRLGIPARPDGTSTPDDKKAEDRSGKNAQPTDDRPKSPEESLKMMQVKPGYRVELVAAEPLVRDPVAFDWGPDGKLWVAEMADYPLGVPDGELDTEHTEGTEKRNSEPQPSVKSVSSVSKPFAFKKGGGRVRFLEDTDGDGKYDKSTVFLDKLNFPNGVMPWRDGVLISAAPEVLFARDTNGDGRADEVKVLLTGFGEGNQQHRVNGFSWGLDNMVHCANGDSGGAITVVASLRDAKSESRSDSATKKTIDIRGRDFRWNPDTGELDPTSGQTQFGRNRDDFGNWFGNNNANPMYHFVLDDFYTRRNPHVAPPDPRKHVSINPGPSPVFPISRTLSRFNDFAMANRFTSANSAMVYRDELLFRRETRDESREGKTAGNSASSLSSLSSRLSSPQHVFISEPVHNLVHHEIMTADGATFTSRRADDEQQSEFLASKDNWFRPTQIKTGPDGALYIADMYRQVIEHPQYIPPAMQEKLDLRAGHDKGRIYRVVRDGQPLHKFKPLQLAKENDGDDLLDLVGALDHPNGWQRDMVHRLLYWKWTELRDAKSLLPSSIQADRVRELVFLTGVGLGMGQPQVSDRVAARVQALAVLQSLGVIRERDIREGLADQHPAVRRIAIQACEKLKPPFPDPLFNQLTAMGNDPDSTVRMQLAYTLGHPRFTSLGNELGKLLYRERDDKYLVAAAMSSIHAQNVSSVVANFLELSAAEQNASRGATSPTLASTLLGLASTLGNDQALLSLIEYVLSGAATSESQPMVLAQMLDNLERRKTSLADLKEVDPQRLARAQQQLAEFLAAARTTISEFKSEISNLKSEMSDSKHNAVLAALPLLGREKPTRTEDAKLVGGLLVPQTAVPVQTAAVGTLARMDDPETPAVLLSGWKTFTPALRAMVLDALLSRPSWTAKLLDELEAKSIAPSDIDAARRQRLLTHANTDIRGRAAKLLEVSANADRQKLVAEFAVKLKELDAAGNAVSGAEVFKKRCATCHKLKDIGTSVGSDLVSLTDKSTAALLTAILDPNKAVEAKFLAYTASNKQGQVFSGLIAAETGNSITLMAADGKQHTLLRADLDEFISSAKSFMPEGLERDVLPSELADVIAFVQSSGPPPKKFDGNQPEPVMANTGGTLHLLASNAEIYGKTLVFEPPFKNLGYWGSVDDRAVWTINVKKPGKHSIRMNYACDNSTAGNEVVFEVAGQSVQAKIVGTGSWENYQTAILGELDLPAGQHRLTVRATEMLKNHLMDLKELRLVPE